MLLIIFLQKITCYEPCHWTFDFCCFLLCFKDIVTRHHLAFNYSSYVVVVQPTPSYSSACATGTRICAASTFYDSSNQIYNLSVFILKLGGKSPHIVTLVWWCWATEAQFKSSRSICYYMGCVVDQRPALGMEYSWSVILDLYRASWLWRRRTYSCF